VGALEPQFFAELVRLLGVEDRCPGQMEFDRFDEMRALFAEKAGGAEPRIRDALSLDPGEKVIAVEDVITKGGSVAGAIAAAEARGATLAAVACIIDRSQAPLPWAVHSLAKLTIPTYPQDECPLCRAGVPLQEV